MIVVSSRVDNQATPDIAELCEKNNRKVLKYEKAPVSCSGGGTRLTLHIFRLDHPDGSAPKHLHSAPRPSSAASSVKGVDKEDAVMKDKNEEEATKADEPILNDAKPEEKTEEVPETKPEENKCAEATSSDLLISDDDITNQHTPIPDTNNTPNDENMDQPDTKLVSSPGH
eukprot:Platyproteum_vivax@DN14177_c0_g1_i1.p1